MSDRNLRTHSQSISPSKPLTLDWAKLHSVPRDWEGRQISKLLTADEAGRVPHLLAPAYTGMFPAIGALTLGDGKPAARPGLLQAPWDDHLLTIAPTRSGKGVSQIIPNLLTYTGSVLVVDIKGENYAVTSGHRSTMHPHAKVVKFAPFSEDTAKFNPLNFIRADTDHALDDALVLAEMLVPETGGSESFWVNEARSALVALLLHVVADPRDHEHGGTIQRLVELVLETPLSHVLEDMIEHPAHSTPYGWAVEFNEMDERLRGNIITTLKSALRIWQSPLLLNATNGNDISLRDLKASAFSADDLGPVSLYLVIPPEYLRSHRAVLRVVVGLAVKEMTRPHAAGWLDKPKQPILFMLDELPALGFMPPVLDGLGYLAGYGVRLWSFAQSVGQLRRIYGEEWESFASSAGAFTAFGINDYDTAAWLARLLGETDEYQQYYKTMTDRVITQTDRAEYLRRMNKNNGPFFPDPEMYKEWKREVEADGWTPQLDGDKWEKTIQKETTASRFTKDQVAAPHLIRQLGDRFGLAFLRGQKPALYRKIPYHAVATFKRQAGSWQP